VNNESERAKHVVLIADHVARFDTAGERINLASNVYITEPVDISIGVTMTQDDRYTEIESLVIHPFRRAACFHRSMQLSVRGKRRSNAVCKSSLTSTETMTRLAFDICTLRGSFFRHLGKGNQFTRDETSRLRASAEIRIQREATR